MVTFAAQLRAYITANPGCSILDLEANVPGKNHHASILVMLPGGMIRTEGTGKTRKLWLLREARVAMTPAERRQKNKLTRCFPKAPPPSSVDGLTTEQIKAAGIAVEILPSRYEPPVAYPRPMFRRGKGGE